MAGPLTQALAIRATLGRRPRTGGATQGDPTMTKELQCGDLMPGCDFRATGATEDEVMRQAAEHAKRDHGVEVTPELADQVRAAIRDR